MKKQMSDDLLTKYLLGESSPDEVLEVEAWAAADSDNARKLQDMKIILETSHRLAQASPLTETEAWERFKRKREAAINEKTKDIPLRAYQTWLRIAAVLLVFVGGGWMAYYFYNIRSNSSTDWISLKAGSQVRTDTLPDGSVVHINKNSALAYSGNFESKREVKLTGEAFFDVRHNDAVPFTVKVGDILVQDIGTAFNIKSRQYTTEIIVASGVVKVSRNKNAVQLNAHQMVNIKPEDNAFKVENNSDKLYNYYISNTFTANKTPLWRLTEVLQEAYGADIRIENKALRNVPITANIKLQDRLEDILELIRLTTSDMHVQKQGQVYIIK